MNESTVNVMYDYSTAYIFEYNLFLAYIQRHMYTCLNESSYSHYFTIAIHLRLFGRLPMQYCMLAIYNHWPVGGPPNISHDHIYLLTKALGKYAKDYE